MVELCELNINEWQSNIDEHIALLDFNSNKNSLNNSLLFISNDSLDFDKLHRNCCVNKEDYKITFEDDSGQWTTTSENNLTNWGNIHCNENDKANSLPEFKIDKKSDLLSKFVERQSDYELYIGNNGKYVDYNYNEVTLNNNNVNMNNPFDRWNLHNFLVNPIAKPKRTFANFNRKESSHLEGNDEFDEKLAPSLEFLAMEHEVPSFCDISSSMSSTMSLYDIIIKIKDDGIICSDKFNVKLDEGPDSGLGSSNYSTNNGPVHIEDWPSLAVLLPKSVVETISFFKVNSQLLTSSVVSSAYEDKCNNIERINSKNNRSRWYEACRTCFGLRMLVNPSPWIQPLSARNILCNCTNSEILDRRSLSICRDKSVINRYKLHSRELSIIGLPVYNSKRILVEQVVEGVAEFARTGSRSSLCYAMEKLIADGLKGSADSWQIIEKITSPGPATDHIYSFVHDLNNNEAAKDCRVFLFLEELLRLESLDCWVYYAVIKGNILKELYNDGSFFLTANTSYRSLFFRLLENLEYLTFIEVNKSPNYKLVKASRLAKDSRIPKSSSLPSRLVAFKPTRIPKLINRPVISRDICVEKLSKHSSALAITDYDFPGMLPVRKDEPLFILTKRGPYVRCCRTKALHNRVFQGLLPMSIVSIKQFSLGNSDLHET